MPGPSPIAALVYPENAYPDAFVAALVARMQGAGVSMAGVIQHEEPAEKGPCAMLLEEIGTGRMIPISEDRGEEAQGCRLDMAGIAAASAAIAQSIAERAPRLVFINKFGKSEALGGGLRDVVVSALETGVPLVICVPEHALQSWRDFAGPYAAEFPASGEGLGDWLEKLGLPAVQPALPPATFSA